MHGSIKVVITLHFLHSKSSTMFLHKCSVPRKLTNGIQKLLVINYIQLFCLFILVIFLLEYASTSTQLKHLVVTNILYFLFTQLTFFRIINNIVSCFKSMHCVFLTNMHYKICFTEFFCY